MAFSREIIKKVLQYVRFRVPQTEEKNSYYTEIGNTLVRVSNHCTWLYRWDEILEKNPKWKGKPIVSIVFEDSGNTFSDKCLVLRRFRMKPIKVMEYVYPLQGNPQFITPQDERLIINGIKQIQGGKYTDLTNKCSEPILRISQNPPDVPPTKTMNNNENKQYNRNMNKKLIRLNESDLHKIVKESVNRILKESFMHQDFWEPAAVISKEEILDVLDSWCLDNPQFEEAAKALQRMMYKAAKGRIDNRGKFIRKSDGTITDYEGNPVQRAVGDDDRYTRSQEMRDPWGGY